MKPTRLLFLFALLSPAFAACNGAPGAQPERNGSPDAQTACSGTPDAQTACTDLNRAYCDLTARCFPHEMQIEFGGDTKKCVARSAWTCSPSFSTSGSEMTPTLIESCANALNAQSCADYAFKQPAACSPPRGTLADGVACWTDSQCKGGWCDLAATAKAGCGTCAEKAQAPQTGCASTQDCPGSQVCTAGTCEDPGGVGAPCGSGQPDCRGDLMCQSPAVGGVPGRCVPLPATPGAGCSPRNDCGGGLVCMGDRCRGATYAPPGGTCNTWYGGLPSAESDAGIEACSGGKCVSGRCIGYAEVGDPCGPTDAADSDPLCVYGSKCVKGVCAALPSLTCP